MAKTSFKKDFELTLKNEYTKVECSVSLTVDGKSLPTMATLGDAMEQAIAVIQQLVTESYNVVPARPVPSAAHATPAQGSVGNLLQRAKV